MNISEIKAFFTAAYARCKSTGIRLLICLTLPFAVTVAHSQNLMVEGAADITHPPAGDVLTADANTIYFSPGSIDIYEWRITLGTSPNATGLFDSGVRVLDRNPWEISLGAIPTDGKPVTMRFWQRKKRAAWITFDTQYNTAIGSSKSVQEEVAVVQQPIVASEPSVVVPLVANLKSAKGDVVQSLKALHRNGQTFLTWTELKGDARYHVYRHGAPITSSNVASAELLTGTWGPLDSDTSVNKHASGAVPTTYVIEDLGAPLSPQNGLFVHTSRTSERAYYAVTSVINGRETTSFVAGENSLPEAVSESVARPQPVLTLSLNKGKGRVYTQYMDYANWNPTFNGYAYNYLVTLPAGYRSSRQYPLLINPHAYGETVTVKEESEWGWQVIQLFPMDPGADQGALNSWWYGYAAEHNYNTDGPVPAKGAIVNFTEQRVMMAVEHLLDSSDFSVDPLLVHAYGHSMGASGSLSYGIRYGNLIAGVFGSEAMTNYRTSPVFQADFEQLWGSQSSNLPIINRGPFSENIKRYNGTGVWDWMDHHKQLVQRRGDKMGFLMLAQGKADDIIDWETQGEPLARVFNDAKVGFTTRFEAGAGHGWLGFSAIVKPLFGFGYDDAFPWRYPRNLSFPSIQNASGSGPLQPGLDIHDSYNLDIEWATSHTRFAKKIVDKPKRYEISVRSTGSEQTADITPRNTQQFVVNPGDDCRYKVVDNNGRRLLSEGVVTADADALLTVKAVQITEHKGSKLSIDCR